MKKIISRIERVSKALNTFPTIVKQRMTINTLEGKIEALEAKKKELQDVIKSDLYKDFMAKLEAPHKIIDLQNTLKLRTQQRNAVREENTKLREELKKQKDQSTTVEQITRQRDRYKKQVKTLKDIIKEGK